MKVVYELEHKNLIELDSVTGKEICDTKLLGYFSSKDKCYEAIDYYLQQPGFCDAPERFFIEEVEADVNDFNDVVGEFNEYVYCLGHEWYKCYMLPGDKDRFSGCFLVL